MELVLLSKVKNMGSYNVACGVSGLSLIEKQKVKLIFLAEERHGGLRSDILFPCSYGWDVCSFPIDATYVDCGEYDFDEKGESWKLFVEFLYSHGMKEGTVEKDFFNKVFNGTIGIKTNSENPEISKITKKFLEVKILAIQEEIYSYIIKPKDTIYGTHSVESFVEADRKIVEGFEKFIKKQKGIYIQSRDFLNSEFNKFFKERFEKSHWSCLGELDMLNYFLARVCLPFRPSMYAGQDSRYNWEESEKFHTKISEIASRKLKEN